MAIPSRRWQDLVLVGIGAIPTPTNRRALVLWGRTEGGGGRNNPLNTTMPAPGDSKFNSAGVRNYPDEDTGIRATIRTLQLRYYVAVVGALRRGTLQDIYDAIHRSPWCGRCCQHGQYPAAFAAAGVRLAPRKVCDSSPVAEFPWGWLAFGVAAALGVAWSVKKGYYTRLSAWLQS
jgi:hypothetical protein